MGMGEAFKVSGGSWKGICLLCTERGRKIAIECYTNCIHNGAHYSISTSRPCRCNLFVAFSHV